MKSIIFVHSYHHQNTRKIADAIATKLNADIAGVEAKFHDNGYDVFGFGSGIDGGKHYREMLDYVSNLPNVDNKKAFIFSTSATYSDKRMVKEHGELRNLLISKGFEVIGEFGCKGFTTRSIFNLIGGVNKGHPDDEDVKNAVAFSEAVIVRSCFRDEIN